MSTNESLDLKMRELRTLLLQSWADARELDRNQLLEVVRVDGGMTALPDWLEAAPSPLRLTGEIASMMIDTLEFVVYDDRDLMLYVDTGTRRFTIAPRDWITMAVEAEVANRDLTVIDLDKT